MIHAFHDPETDGMVYWVPPQAHEEPGCYSDEECSDSGDSTSSDDTITSSEARDYFYEFNGRLFVDSPDVPVWFPVDERQRATVAHQLQKLLYEGNHFGPMSEVLRPQEEFRPRVLDIYTRNGSWVQEMSQEFPNVDFVSLDVAPMVHHVPRKNIVFEVYDIQHGLLEPDGCFDLVRISFVTEILKDTRKLMREAQRVLKPGGLLCMMEPEFAAYDVKDISQPALESAPRTCRMLEAMRASLLLQGVQLDVWSLMENWLAPDSSLWENQGFRVPPFERVSKGVEVVYAGGWDADFRQQQIRLLLARLATLSMRSMSPMLTILGMNNEDILQLVDGAVEELRDLRTQYVCKFHHVFARKTLVHHCRL